MSRIKRDIITPKNCEPMRLSQLLAAGKIRFSRPEDDEDKEYTRQLRSSLCRLAREGVVVNSDEISRYRYDLDKEEGGEGRQWSIEEFPNVAPPWLRFLLEWQTDIDRCDGGVVCDASDLKEEGNKAGITAYINETTKLHQEHYEEALDSSRWAMIALVYLSDGTFVHPVSERFLFLIQESGRPALCTDMDGHLPIEELRAVGHEVVVHTLFSLQVINCKNTRLVDREHLPRRGMFKKKDRCPRVQYKTLEIDGIKGSPKGDGDSEETGIKKAFHSCRGHFKTYTAEKPLFGRADGVGTFWVHEHTKGSKKHGEVIKDYRIKMNQS